MGIVLGLFVDSTFFWIFQIQATWPSQERYARDGPFRNEDRHAIATGRTMNQVDVDTISPGRFVVF